MSTSMRQFISQSRAERRQRVVNETLERIDGVLLDISPDLAMAVCRKAWTRSQSRFITRLRRQHERENEYAEQQDRLRCAVACTDQGGAGEPASAEEGNNATGER